MKIRGLFYGYVMLDIYLLFLVLLGTLILFVWGYWRYDIVAIIALGATVILGIVPADQAFIGFSNPAVITVACVMILTYAITQSGIVELVVKRLTPLSENVIIHVGSLTLLTGILSAFMNNIGALALMMPVAIRTAINNKRSPSLILMPLAFGSVLGGMTTVIGTPPNLLISAYRQEITGHPFAMFDFSPVGVSVAFVAIVFIALIGWRLVPQKRQAQALEEDLFYIQDYISEVKIPDDSPIVGKTRRELERLVEGDFTIIGLIRNKQKRLVIQLNETLQAKDILIIEASHEDLKQLVEVGKLELVGDKKISTETLRGGNVELMEAVVPPGSRVEGRSWQRVRLGMQVNLLAIARQGSAFKNRLNQVNLRAGDVVLLQGEGDELQDAIGNLGLLPLAERGIQAGRRRLFLPFITFIIAIIIAGMQLLTVAVSFMLGALFLVITNTVPLRRLYSCIDCSIIVMLAAMIPLGTALQTTGATTLIANFAVNLAGHMAPPVMILIILIVTMSLSDLMNNAATAVVMGPIAVSIADALQVSMDPFLIAVAVGASCAFLTPIGHQNNILVMGPGGYKFFDYLYLGLPVELIVVLVGLPSIMWFWPV